MKTHSNLSASATALAAATTLAFSPPAHVRRWTGRSPLTIPLPSLAALRITGTDSPASRAGAVPGRS